MRRIKFSATSRGPFRRALRNASIRDLQRVLGFERLENRNLLTTVTFTPIADTTLYEDPNGTLANGTGGGLFAGVTASLNQDLLRRALLKFDVASTIPVGATVNSVSLRLSVTRTPSPVVSTPMALHEVSADWGEGTTTASGQGGAGGASTPNSATWRHRFFSGTAWANLGGDFDSAASSTTAVSGLGNYVWTGSGLVADVQGWVNASSTQFGWLLKATNETISKNAKRFGSRENTDANLRPLLTIDYTSVSNKPPTLDPISNPQAILEDAASQIVSLTGISAGQGESQTLSVTAVSNNLGLIPNPTVTYVSPNSSGTLAYTPVANQSGTAIITVTVTDNGGTANGGVDTISRTFTVTVNPVNDAPTLDSIANPSAILEDAGAQTINLSGISAGPIEIQTLTVNATSSNPGLIPNPTVTYVSPSLTGTLAYSPVTNESGTAIITVVVTDNGGTGNGGVNAFTRSFTVTVNPVNDAPTLDSIANPNAILEDAGSQTVNLSGITPGPNEAQPLTVAAVSSNPGLIPNPTVTYTSPNSTGTLGYAPVANQSGTATITVTVTDNGGTANGGVDTITRTFTVTVNSVNDAPTVDSIANPTAILEDASAQTVNLSGISAGPDETQTLTVTAVSGNPGLIPHPTVTYTSPNATGTLAYTPVGNQSGTTTITVIVTDNGGTADGGVDTTRQTFTVTVVPLNDAPTLDSTANPTAILEDAAVQTINLTGISAGPEETQTLTITAASSNPGLIPNPTVTYTSPNATGTLAYAPVANQSGTATITVTVADNGGTAGGGVDMITRTFTVTVDPVNDAPTLDSIANPATILQGAGAQTINLTGISAGPSETQTLTVTAASSNPALIPNPTVTYTSPNATGTLGYTPIANQSGTATITVTVTDNGGTANGGVDTVIRTFVVTVSSVNRAPTLDSIANPIAILEDASAQTVSLTGITAGPDEVQTITVNAASSNPGLIPNPIVTYTNPNSTGALAYTPVANQFGTATITVTVTDNGGTAGGGVDTITRSFTVTVDSVNDAPTLDAIANPAPVPINQGVQTVNLSGISAGPNESQTLMVMAVSSNLGLIPNPLVNYTSSNPTGSLSYTPVANQAGTATITVTVTDDGSTASGGVNATTRTFTISVNSANQAPTLDAIPNPATIPEDAIAQTITLTGITAGPTESQPLAVTTVSDNPGLIPAPTVTYTSPEATGTLTYTPLANQSGQASITVLVEDGGLDSNLATKADNSTTSRQFTVTVSPVNDPPIANSDVFNLNQETLTILGLLANDTDIDSMFDTTSFEFRLGPASGTLTVTASGNVEYRPNQNYFGQDAFSYRVADTQGAFTDWANVNLAINARPIAMGELKFLNSKTPTNIDVLANDSDPDGLKQDLQIIIVTNLDPSIGQFEVVTDKLVRFTPGTSFAGSVQLSYRLRDALGAESPEAIAMLGVYNQNPQLAEDVNNSGLITPFDVLLIINTINVEGGRPIPPGNHLAPYYDVNADGFVTPFDALLVINYLNSHLTGEGEFVRSDIAVPPIDSSLSSDFADDLRDWELERSRVWLEPDKTDLSSSEPLKFSRLAEQCAKLFCSAHIHPDIESTEHAATDEVFSSIEQWLTTRVDLRDRIALGP